MGFKRTSEGRVFFQGGTQGPQDNQPRAVTVKNGADARDPALLQSQQMQVQIVALLRALNERLKTAQEGRAKMERELEAYRALIGDLENRAERSERERLDMERRIAGIAARRDDGQAAELLQETLKELQETRRHLVDLEDKAERAGQGVAVLTGRQAALENLQREQAEKAALGVSSFTELSRRIRESEEKQENLTAKIEETGAQHARLARKVDKAVEDRIRFMRKIERIEETVLQTRDSLNARAMVLLTDQAAIAGPAAEAETGTYPAAAHHADPLFPLPGAPDARETAAADETYSLPWWRGSRRAQAVGISMLVVAALIGGWFISELQKPQIPGAFSYDPAPEEQTAGLAQVPAPEFEAETGAVMEADPGADLAGSSSGIASLDWSVEPSEEPAESGWDGEAAPSQTPSASAAAPADDDIGALDLSRPEDVELLLEKTPAEAAALLNRLEPSPPVAAPAPETAPETAQAAVDGAALKPSDTAAPPLSDPRTLARPDAALPELIKEIETQAFDGVPEAQHDLAAIYTAGHGGVKQDYRRAAFWFEQAALRGVANAAYNLGVLHHQGLGMKPDLQKALDWYGRAAALGHPEAQYNLGIAYIEGIGVGYDPEKAASFFKNAADKDIMEAAYNLGLIYENGLLGEARPDEALMWYKTAADRGSPEARQALEQLAKSLNIKLEDVNRLVDNMKGTRKSDAAPALTGQKAPQKAARKAAATPAPRADSVLIAQIQEYLHRAGLFPGPADGAGGPLTEDAIRSYQKQNGLQPDGRATGDLLTHMLSSAP